jgi:hypothetical protein
MGSHRYITMETLLFRLSIEGNVNVRRTLSSGVLSRGHQLKMSSGTLPRINISNRRFGEPIVSIFRGPYVDEFPHMYYRGNTVTQPLHKGIH